MAENTGPFTSRMTDKEFQRLSEFIENELGVKMPASKKVMLESRLQRRLRTLGYVSFSEYCDYLFSSEGIENELAYMVDIVTTHKTDFFREPAHFEYLVQHALPQLIKDHGAGVQKKLMIWSAGCSTGEEPYSLAMVLSEFKERYPGLGFQFMIIASDVSVPALNMATRGIYNEERVAPVSMPLRKKYLLKGKDRSGGLVRIAPEIRSLVKFRQLNFMEGDFGFRERMDIIFCRNVLIYFDKDTQERLINRFCGHLTRGGYIFVGHSESLSGLRVPLDRVSAAVYRLSE